MPQLKTKKKSVKKSPLWKGPEVDGISQSLLGDYLVCKERFRIKTIEGLAPADEFNHRIEYGNMWHLCEEIYLLADPKKSWQDSLKVYCIELMRKYKTQQEQIEKWYQVCKLQFPLYQEYWRKKIKKENQTPILQEENFKVQYELPSGRFVNLRGKLDAVNLIGKGRNAGLYLQENKAKGEIKEEQICRQVSFDIQTMIYLIALQEMIDNNEFVDTEGDGKKIKGIIYNVVHRPLSGGKGSIRPLKATSKKPAETLPAYYERLKSVIIEDDDTYFMRWKIEITQQDIEKFEVQTLIPVLENLLDDYEWWSYCYKKYDRGSDSQFDFEQRQCHFHYHQNRHFRLPYGIYSTILENRVGDLDEYLLTGSTVGLERPKTLFPELE